jgi:hypothetical protein
MAMLNTAIKDDVWDSSIFFLPCAAELKTMTKPRGHGSYSTYKCVQNAPP